MSSEAPAKLLEREQLKLFGVVVKRSDFIESALHDMWPQLNIQMLMKHASKLNELPRGAMNSFESGNFRFRIVIIEPVMSPTETMIVRNAPLTGSSP